LKMHRDYFKGETMATPMEYDTLREIYSSAMAALTRVGRRVKGRGRQIARLLKERIIHSVKANPHYTHAVDRLKEKRRETHGRASTIRETKGKTPHIRRREDARRLARIGALQSDITRTQGRSFRKDKNRVHGLSRGDMARDQFHPKMLLQTDVSDRLAGGRRSDQGVRRQRDSHSHDERRGVGIKESFKQFMKQHKGKEVEMVDAKSAQRSSPQPAKQHSKESVKAFFKNRQKEKSREREW
jgi:hypothetical protein